MIYSEFPPFFTWWIFPVRFFVNVDQRLVPEAAGRASGEGLRDARPWALRGEGPVFSRIPLRDPKGCRDFLGDLTYFFWDNLQQSMK
jgi:hypothetical protein